MNFIINKHNKPPQPVTIPDGLSELLSDISREVLRDQPTNPYEYIADYLSALVVTREHAAVAKRNVDAIVSVSMNVSDLLQNTGISKKKASRIIEIVQATLEVCIKQINEQDTDLSKKCQVIENDILQKILQECTFSVEEAIRVKRIIRSAFKDFYYREKEFQFKLSRIPGYEWVNRAERTLDIYRKAAPEKWQLERAAIVIQAAYRGYFARKLPKEVLKYHQSAAAIQARFRGYQTRKQLSNELEAATKIQNAFRSYKKRKKLQFKVGPDNDDTDEESLPVLAVTDSLDYAVTKIQAAYRGFKIRKEIMDQGEAAKKIQAMYRGYKVRCNLPEGFNRSKTSRKVKFT